MNKLTDQTREALHAINTPRGLWDRISGATGTLGSEILAIADSGEPAAIPHLAHFLLDSRRELREATAACIRRLLDRVAPLEYVQLDEIARNAWAYEAPSTESWRCLSPERLERLGNDANQVVLAAIASLHGNGYVRESAVKLLSTEFSGLELPFLLVRLNDWVGAVRESAAKAIVRRNQPDYASYFLRHLPLVLRLRACGRGQNTPVADSVAELLSSPSAAILIREGMASGDRNLRRECYRLAEKSAGNDRLTALRLALVSSDPVLRLWASRSIVAEVSDAELDQILVDLLHDRFGPVRVEGLTVIANRYRANARERLVPSLLDQNAGVRAAARYLLNEIGAKVDCAAVYREAIGEGTTARCRAAISGLGETGGEADDKLLAAFLMDQNPRLRRAAVRGLAALSVDRNRGLLQGMLADPDGGVSIQAAKVLAPKIPLMDEAALVRVFIGSEYLHVRINSYGLLTQFPVWKAGPYILAALADREDAIAKKAASSVRGWLARIRRLPIGPSRGDLAGVREAYDRHSKLLKESERRELGSFLQSYS